MQKLKVLLLSGLLLCTAGLLAAQPAFPTGYTQCSVIMDPIPTTITFENRSSESVTIYWVSYDCELVFYSTLWPGESHLQETSVTHPWVVIGDETLEVLYETVALSTPQTAIITDTPGRSIRDRVDDAADLYQVQLVYVLPLDGVDAGLDVDGTLAASAAAWNDWLILQTGGTRLRLDTYNEQLDIVFVLLTSTDAELAAEGLFIRDRIERELAALGFDHPQKIYAVYYGGTVNGACGGGAWPPTLPGRVAAMYLGGQFDIAGVPDCDTNPFAATMDEIGYMEFAMIHEIVHTLGVVAECAPNHTRAGHVSDMPQDLMYAGDQPWQPLLLDIGRDDYYGHGRPGCLDLARSVFMEPLPPNAEVPPGWPLP